MAASFKSEIVINAPARRVFQVLSDPSLLVQWMNFAQAVALEPEGPMRRGTRIHVFASPDSEISADVEVTEFTPPRAVELSGSLTWRSEVNQIATRFEVEDYGSTTKLIAVTTARRLGWWANKLFPLATPLLRRSSAYELRKIKELAEETQRGK
jgi:uncharacterized protein YndB with AHSA1/START domain